MRLLTISGPSGVGKTSLATIAAGNLNCPIVHLDDFYKRGTHPDLYDTPEAFDWHALHSTLGLLANGFAVHYPRYDYNTGLDLPGPGVSISATDSAYIIVEGLYAYRCEPPPVIGARYDILLQPRDIDETRRFAKKQLRRRRAYSREATERVVNGYMEHTVPHLNVFNANIPPFDTQAICIIVLLLRSTLQ